MSTNHNELTGNYEWHGMTMHEKVNEHGDLTDKHGKEGH